MNKWKALCSYLPWLLLLLCMDAFFTFLLWLAAVQAFWPLAPLLFLFSLFLFLFTSLLLWVRSEKRRQAFLAFLETPDEVHEKSLRNLLPPDEAENLASLSLLLQTKEKTARELEEKLEGYEDYVELWAHEIKTPLSLLTLVLENRRQELPDNVAFKLDYIRSQTQEQIDHMLFFARLRSATQDYRFMPQSLRSLIEEVLDDYRPLLEEKSFQIFLEVQEEQVFTDRRSFCFLLSQMVSNAIKYTGQNPVLRFTITHSLPSAPAESGGQLILHVCDNGPGVRPCDLPFLFEKGFTGSGTARKKATGMGLYLAREIAENLGLTLEASSEWGHGLELRIIFPVVSGIM